MIRASPSAARSDRPRPSWSRRRRRPGAASTAPGRAPASRSPTSPAGWWAWSWPRALSAPDFKHTGWRIAFLLGALVLPVGLIIRRSLPETRQRHDGRAGRASHPARGGDLWRTIVGHWRIIVLGLCLIAAATISTYVFSFMTTYAHTTLHMGVHCLLGDGGDQRHGQFSSRSLAGGAALRPVRPPGDDDLAARRLPRGHPALLYAGDPHVPRRPCCWP